MRKKHLVERLKLASNQVMAKCKPPCMKFARLLKVTQRGFTTNQIQQGASALTYYTLLAFIPTFAFMWAIARGFLFEETLLSFLKEKFSASTAFIDELIILANRALTKANIGIVSGLGVLLLIWSALKILYYLELGMNQIWEVSRGRSFSRRFADYLALLFLCPLIIIISSGSPAFFSILISSLEEKELLIFNFTSVAHFFVHIIPYLLNSFLLTFLYIFVPNTQVKFFPAFCSGLITGIIYQIIQLVLFYFQIGAISYNALYGTLAAIPIFLIWVHLSWVVVLLGTKITFAIQNINSYQFISEEIQPSPRCYTILFLLITHFCTKRYIKAEPPPTIIEMANSLSIPLSLARHATDELVEAKVLIETTLKDEDELGYYPGRDTDQLTIKSVIDMIDTKGDEVLLPHRKEVLAIRSALAQFDSLVARSKQNTLIKEI